MQTREWRRRVSKLARSVSFPSLCPIPSSSFLPPIFILDSFFRLPVSPRCTHSLANQRGRESMQKGESARGHNLSLFLRLPLLFRPHRRFSPIKHCRGADMGIRILGRGKGSSNNPFLLLLLLLSWPLFLARLLSTRPRLFRRLLQEFSSRPSRFALVILCF